MDPQVAVIPEFRVYNRYQELERREREKKEKEWEQELLNAMNMSSAELSNNHFERNQLQSCRSCPKLNQNSLKFNSKMKKPKSYDNESFDKKNFEFLDDEPPKKSKEKTKLKICVSCSNSSGKNLENYPKLEKLSCDIEKKLQNLDFIDRTPSPTEKHHQ